MFCVLGHFFLHYLVRHAAHIRFVQQLGHRLDAFIMRNILQTILKYSVEVSVSRESIKIMFSLCGWQDKRGTSLPAGW